MGHDILLFIDRFTSEVSGVEILLLQWQFIWIILFTIINSPLLNNLIKGNITDSKVLNTDMKYYSGWHKQANYSIKFFCILISSILLVCFGTKFWLAFLQVRATLPNVFVVLHLNTDSSQIHVSTFPIVKDRNWFGFVFRIQPSSDPPLLQGKISSFPFDAFWDLKLKMKIKLTH